MSKQITLFMKRIIEEPEVRPEYIKKLERMKKEGEYITFNTMEEFKQHFENESDKDT